MAEENPRWGYTRIRGALANLGHDVARNTDKRWELGVRPRVTPRLAYRSGDIRIPLPAGP